MTRDEFQKLAEAYGGEIARWPAALRDEAALLVTADTEFARGVLAREAELDIALDNLPRVQPSAALYERILTEAPAARRKRRWRLWLAPAGLGAALAGAAAAGLIVGVQLSQESATSVDTAAQAVADLDVSAVAEVG